MNEQSSDIICRDENPGHGSLGLDREASAPHEEADSFSERRLEMIRDFEMKESYADELLDWLMEHGMIVGRERKALKTDWPLWMASFIKILAYIFKRHRTPACFAALYVWGEDVLDDILGNMSQSQFAASISRNGDPLTKAAVNKACMDAAAFFGTPPRRDQRRHEACERMSQKRIENLQTKL